MTILASALLIAVALFLAFFAWTSGSLTEAEIDLLKTAVRGRRMRVRGFQIGRYFISVLWLGGPGTNPTRDGDVDPPEKYR